MDQRRPFHQFALRCLYHVARDDRDPEAENQEQPEEKVEGDYRSGLFLFPPLSRVRAVDGGEDNG